MNFGTAISTCMGKYATFSGRASRSEFWWFYLFAVLIQWGATIAGSSTGGPEMGSIISLISSLIFTLPILAAGSRRLHDIGRTGWWQLIILTGIGVILLIVWFASQSDPSDNRFGGTLVPDS